MLLHFDVWSKCVSLHRNNITAATGKMLFADAVFYHICKNLFMKSGALLYMLLAFAAGAILPIQAGLNSKLARTAANPVSAAFVSFAVGLIALLVYLLVTKQLQINFASAGQHPWWIWIGGFFGAFYVAGLTFLIPELGASLTFSLIIGGQLILALLIDHYGWLGAPINPITFKKVLGILLVIGGVFLIRKP